MNTRYKGARGYSLSESLVPCATTSTLISLHLVIFRQSLSHPFSYPLVSLVPSPFLSPRLLLPLHRLNIGKI